MAVVIQWMSCPQGIMKTLCTFVFSYRIWRSVQEGQEAADLACARAWPPLQQVDRDRTRRGLELEQPRDTLQAASGLHRLQDRAMTPHMAFFECPFHAIRDWRNFRWVSLAVLESPSDGADVMDLVLEPKAQTMQHRPHQSTHPPIRLNAT